MGTWLALFAIVSQSGISIKAADDGVCVLVLEGRYGDMPFLGDQDGGKGHWSKRGIKMRFLECRSLEVNSCSPPKGAW
jgi:hypothetical protein